MSSSLCVSLISEESNGQKNENILELVIQLPWWVSFLFFGFAYSSLKWVLPAMASGNMWGESAAPGLSQVAHFAAFVLLIPALISFFTPGEAKGH